MKIISNFKFQISNWILVGIVFLAFLIRFLGINSIPPGLTWDEAALGYNAYSLMLTGKDEYGNLLPVNLKSFGDYKPAFYSYLIIPFILFFGLSEVAVRMPSVIGGVCFVILLYFLVFELTKNKLLSLAVSFMGAVSPLSIQFSRAGFESNLAVTLNLFGVYLFLKSKDKRWLLVLSALVFGISLFTYQASRLFLPLLIIGLVVIYRKRFGFDRVLIASALVMVVFIMITGLNLFLFGQSSRLETANYFAYRRSQDESNLISREDGLNKDNLTFQIIHGEWFYFTRGLFERYLIYFSPKMLFIDGDYSPRHSIPDLGVLYFVSAVLIPLGIYQLRKIQGLGIIFYWMAIAPIPAVLSRDLINMVRALNLLVPFTILEGAGLFFIVKFLLGIKRLFGVTLGGIFAVLVLLNIFIYLDAYFIHFPKEQSQGFLYGYKDALKSVSDYSKYNKVVITDFYGQPYIYYLFYTKYPPSKFQTQAGLEQNTVDVGTVRKIDNIEFRHIFWPEDRGETNSLFIGTLEELPDQDIKPFLEYKIVKEVNFLDAQLAFRVVETK